MDSVLGTMQLPAAYELEAITLMVSAMAIMKRSFLTGKHKHQANITMGSALAPGHIIIVLPEKPVPQAYI